MICLYKFQIFCCEKLQQISLDCLDFIGAPAACNGHWANEMHKEAITYLTIHESNDLSKMIIALLGLQHAGVSSLYDNKLLVSY